MNIYNNTRTAIAKIKETLPAKIIFYFFAAIFPLYLVICCELINFNSIFALKDYIFNGHLNIIIFDVLIIYTIYGAVWIATRRAWIAMLPVGIFTIVLAIANFFKMATLTEPVLPVDLMFVGNMGNLTNFAGDISITTYMYLVIFSFVLYVILAIVFGQKYKLNIWIRIFSPVVLLLSCFFVITTPYIRERLYPKWGLSINVTFDQMQNYRVHGFLATFIINTGNLKIDAPKKYTQANIEAIVDELGIQSDIVDPNFEGPDVILILSEAFWNPELIPSVTYSKPLLNNFNAIAKEGYSGNMISPSFGGGTVRPEFESLTGFTVSYMPTGTVPYQQYVQTQTDSLPRYLKSMGYDTVGVHTYLRNFYKRANAYPNLGFDKFIGMEDLTFTPDKKGGYITDDNFMDVIIDELEASDDDPRFIFGISMENHGTYNGKFKNREYIEAKGDGIGEKTIDMLANLGEGVYDADAALGKLVDYLRTRDRDTLLVVYGDHLPTLGNEYKSFVEGGFISTGVANNWTDKERESMYKTPMLMWSNFKDNTGDIGTISPFHIPSLILDYIDAPKNSLFKFLEQYRKVLPVRSPFFALDPNGKYIDSNENMTKDEAYMEYVHWLFTYDVLMKKGYLLK